MHSSCSFDNGKTGTTTDEQLTESFRKVLSQISEIAERSNIIVKPFSDSSLPHFRSLQLRAQRDVLKAGQVYLSICESSQVSSKGIDPKTFVWNGIKSLGLRPKANCFELMSDEDVVEIHNFQARQIFRNLNYFKYSSYDLEMLFCKDISELFEYDQETLRYLMTWFSAVETGEWTEMQQFTHKPFRIRESQSEFRFELEVRLIAGGPLVDERGLPAATIAIDRATVLRAHNVKGLDSSGNGPAERFSESGPFVS